ncbi:MAG: hypothetical protein IPP71_08915 [Bacteroidetes bacterium]|nr:hypothetical protein [Bacteroidota bacterium]
MIDDCKAAIDSQGYVVDWTINKCSFSQFFIAEEISVHNRNDFRMWDDDDNYDYFYYLPKTPTILVHSLS